MNRIIKIIILFFALLLFSAPLLLIFSGCDENSLSPIIKTVMPYNQWKGLIESGEAVVKNKEKNKLLTVKYQGVYGDKRYKLSNGRGGYSLYLFWYYGFEIFDPKDGKFKKLERGDWKTKVYTHKDINGNIVKEYTK